MRHKVEILLGGMRGKNTSARAGLLVVTSGMRDRFNTEGNMRYEN